MGRRWAGDGQAMGRRWTGDGQAMGRRWAGDGQAMRRQWAGDGQAMRRRWAGDGQGPALFQKLEKCVSKLRKNVRLRGAMGGGRSLSPLETSSANAGFEVIYR